MLCTADKPPSSRSLSQRLFPLIAWAFLLSQPSLGAPDEEQKPHPGAAIYASYCAACHGEKGDGNGLMVGQLPQGSPHPSELASWIFQDARSDQKLRQVIRGGGSAVHKSSSMPAWGEVLSESQIDDLVAYIRELKSGAAPSLSEVEPLEDELEIGRALYSIRCLPCHGARGQGDGFLLDSLAGSGTAPAGLQMPDFSRYETIRGKSDANFEAIILSGIGHSKLALKTSSGWWNRPLQVAELRALILYIRSLPRPEPSE